MRPIYLIVRFYPFWALPVALILGELGRHFGRRAGIKKWKWICWAGSVFLLTLIVLWFIGRGDLNSDRWVRQLF
jgi:hypothetical protein